MASWEMMTDAFDWYKNLRLDITDCVLVPGAWIHRHQRFHNLELLKPIQELMMSTRKSESLLADILYGFDQYSSPMYYLYHTKSKQWVKIYEPDSSNPPPDFWIFEEFKCKDKLIELPILDIYNYVWDINDSFTEAYYNKRMASYFCGKLPIRLKEMCPKYGYEWEVTL